MDKDMSKNAGYTENKQCNASAASIYDAHEQTPFGDLKTLKELLNIMYLAGKNTTAWNLVSPVQTYNLLASRAAAV